MVNVHNRKSKAFRPDEAAEYKPALDRLEARDLTMQGYLRACLVALNADPDATLARMAPHWPADEGERPARRAPTESG